MTALSYQPTTGWVTDFSDPDGDGEQVDYCLTLDPSTGSGGSTGDVLIGQKRIEDGLIVSDKWLVSMKVETFNRLVELWAAVK